MGRIRWLLLFGLVLVSCSKKTQAPKAENTGQPAAVPTQANASPAAETPTAPAAATNGAGVKTEMRNVMFHWTPTAAAHLRLISGELKPIGTNDMVVLDDKASFELRVATGTVSISPQALADILNGFVFAKKDAPLKDLSISIDNSRLILKGKLHSKGDIPFGTAGTLSVNADGRLRVHTEKITALKLPVKGFLGLFGVELANLMHTSNIAGIETDRNDLLLDMGELLPPPRIRGKLTGVRVETDAIVTLFGDGGKSLPPPREKGSYMLLEGNPVRFGNLVMQQADLTVLDLDPGATLDWSQDHFREQLVAGYAKITPNFGLRAYVKDYSRLGRPSPSSPGIVPGT